jgi:putative ABC transport system ATP-binding protein
MTPSLVTDRISVSYGAGAASVQALREVSVDFRPGELTLVMGPSGSGKTTLLSVLGGLLTPETGEVSIMGRTLRGLSQDEAGELRKGSIGYVFQAFRLFKALTALENTVLALEISGVRGACALARAKDALAAVGVSHRSALRPAELSGGEKQRVAIARALVNDPPILLADEPTASLDHAAGEQIVNLLHAIAAEQKRIVVVVTHDNRWLDRSDRVIAMSDGAIESDSGAKQ